MDLPIRINCPDSVCGAASLQLRHRQKKGQQLNVLELSISSGKLHDHCIKLAAKYFVPLSTLVPL